MISVFCVGGLHGWRNIASKAIEYVSFGDLSHAGVIWSPGRVLDSRSDLIGGAPFRGVYVRNASYLNAYPRMVVFDLTVTAAQQERTRVFLRDQLGDYYDRPAILGFAANRNWREPGSWFCSELVGAALESSGVLPKLYTPTNKLTPVALATVLSSQRFCDVRTVR